jgi:hypothetical protein
VTDAVMEEVSAWQARPLEPMYPVMFFDALRVKIREEGLVRNKAIYLALGILPDGTRDILGQALAMFDSLAQRILECDAKIEALLVPLGCHDVELGAPAKRRGKNTLGFDVRAALARWAGVDLTCINGLAVTTVMTILSEIGPDWVALLTSSTSVRGWDCARAPGSVAARYSARAPDVPPTGCARRSSWPR